MDEITINTEVRKNYIFKPMNLETEIKQNLENIVSRVKGNVVLERHKGIDTNIVDTMPKDYIRAIIRAGIVTEIEKEEPRFKVNNIKIESKDELENIVVILKGEIVDA